MNKITFLSVLFMIINSAFSQTQTITTLAANGAGNTYEDINAVLAPSGGDVVEAPGITPSGCTNHDDFNNGETTNANRHIQEVVDATMGNVFKFSIHVDEDIDRDKCSTTDRQRNEIKTYGQSPDYLLGVLGESFQYKWSFKLPAGFQSSGSFTHIHQLKSVGGIAAEESIPMITLTIYDKTSSGHKLYVRYSSETSQSTISGHNINISDLEDNWVEVVENITYGMEGDGAYSIKITDIDTGTVLLNYSDDTQRYYKTNADFIRPKWGIYRSLNDPTALRDEEILYGTFTITENQTFTWTGATDNDWHTASNWDTNIVPTTNNTVVIPSGLTNYPTTTSAIEVHSITIESGASFIPQNTVSGTVTYNRDLPDTDWYLVASPVNGETFDDFNANSSALAQNSGGLLGFAPYVNTSSSVWDYQTSASSINLNAGQGYSVKLNASGTISFTGDANTDNLTLPISTGTTSNFNLLGNPFTGYINSGAFALTNTSLLTEQTVWVWNGSLYEAKNATGAIELAPAQGFFVHAADSGNVNFNTSNLNHNSTDTFMKPNAFDGFDLLVDNNNEKKSTKIFYIENKTTGFDNGYDSSIFGGITNAFEVYTGLVDNSTSMKLAIQTLPNNDYENLIIPVGITAEANSELTFSVENSNIDNSINIYLENTLDNSFHNLLNSHYTTTINESSNGTGQFYIHTSAKSLSNFSTELPKDITIIQSSKNQFSILGLESTGTISIISILGKEVLSTSVSPDNNAINLSTINSGMYIIKLNTDSKEIVEKIIL